MGSFVNPNNQAFEMAFNSRIYVDKTGLISYTNSVLDTTDRLICVSRPRRFGKSIAANMLTAYYSKECDSRRLFDHLAISKDNTYEEHLNQYDVIHIDVQWFRVIAKSAKNTVSYMQQKVIEELRSMYSDSISDHDQSLPEVLQRINGTMGKRFIIIIDEWDSLIREDKEDEVALKDYIDLLRGLFKGTQPSSFVKLAYITGILPIIRYDTQSALNEFREFTMLDPGELIEYVGFTENEVKTLCEQYQRDFNEVKKWYDGYCFEDLHVYNPKAIVSVMPRGKFKSYWSMTGTYESIIPLINEDFDQLKRAIITMLSGGRFKVNVKSFQNKMTSFKSRDDVLTVLVHLGYLAYDEVAKEVYIPNEEIREEFIEATQENQWEELTKVYRQSDQLIEATLLEDADTVAKIMEEFHMDYTSIIAYNDENALSSVVSMAYLSALKFYFKPIRELPTGKGYADFVFLPRKECLDKPTLVVELKWNQSATTAIKQIKERKYVRTLEDYAGEILLVGINYDKKSKKHQCIIEKYAKE